MHLIITYVITWLIVVALCKPLFKFLRRQFPLAIQEHERAFFMPMCIAFFGTYFIPVVAFAFYMLFGSIPFTIRVMIAIYLVDLAVLFIGLALCNEIERRNGTVYKKTIADLIAEAKRDHREAKRAERAAKRAERAAKRAARNSRA